MPRTRRGILLGAALAATSAIGSDQAGAATPCFDLRPEGSFVRRVMVVALNDQSLLDPAMLAGYDGSTQAVLVDTLQQPGVPIAVSTIDHVVVAREMYRPNQAIQGSLQCHRSNQQRSFQHGVAIS